MAIQDIDIHSAVVEYIKNQTGNPETDATWNRKLESFGNQDLSELNFQSETITTPTEQNLVDAYDTFITEFEAIKSQIAAIKQIEDSAISKASSIPNWATWTETEALNWHDTNIASQLPVANLTEANAVLQLLETENRALVRMVLALRNKAFPSLEGN